MKKALLLFVIITTALSCSVKKSSIRTDDNDPRLELIKGKWYGIPNSGYSVHKFNRIETDSALITLTFLDKSKLLIESISTNPNANGKKDYYLQNNFLCIDHGERKNKLTRYEIIKLSKDELSYKYYDKKDKTEPVLCGDGETYSFAMQPAFFGTSTNALADYVYQNIDSVDTYSEGAIAALQFDVNCEGKVCNVKDYNSQIYAGTPYAESIKQIIKKMPDWQPATQINRTVNFRIKKIFELNNGKIEVRDIK